jgi:hypothetical protein
VFAAAQQSCNRAATELQQSCNRAATEMQQLAFAGGCGVVDYYQCLQRGGRRCVARLSGVTLEEGQSVGEGAGV